MKILMDTCILSELRRSESVNLIEQTLVSLEPEDLFLSVISVGEIVKGISLLGTSKRKAALQQWAQALENEYSDRILPIDREVVHIWGEITAKAQQQGKIIPAADGLIAATALAHGLHLMTRNIADFEATGVLLINPWENI